MVDITIANTVEEKIAGVGALAVGDGAVGGEEDLSVALRASFLLKTPEVHAVTDEVVRRVVAVAS